GVLGHRLDGVRRLASGGNDAALVEGDDPVLCGDSVYHPRVPAVEVPCQVHEEEDRDTGLRAELAVGEIHTTSGDGAGWCVLVRHQHTASGFLFLICSAYSHSLSSLARVRKFRMRCLVMRLARAFPSPPSSPAARARGGLR